VIRNLVGDGDGIMFKIFLHADDIVVDIQSFLTHMDESEILIAPSTVFHIEGVCKYRVRHESINFNMYQYVSSHFRSSSELITVWHDLDCDEISLQSCEK
jgi:hypothetical protein